MYNNEMQLVEYIKSSGATIPEFAESVGATPAAVYKWISGERRPRDFRKIVSVTGGLVTANDFYGHEERGIDFDKLEQGGGV